MRPFEELAVSFASALVSGEFEQARTLLSPVLQARVSTDELRDRFFGMFEGYAEGSPTRVEFDDEFSLVEWPSKQAGDVGWTYVGVVGDDFVEAICVVVCTFDGVNLIREVEWGRP